MMDLEEKIVPISICLVLGLIVFIIFKSIEYDKSLIEGCVKFEGKTIEQCSYELRRDQVGAY